MALYSQKPKRKAYHLSEAEELLKASERRMHKELYHIFWSNTEEAKIYCNNYQKAFSQLPEQKERISAYGKTPERKARDKVLRQDDDYKKYHREYVKEYRKRPYVQEREDEYLSRPDVKERMKENGLRHAKSETRKEYLYGFRRREKSKEYHRGYENEKRKTDINFNIACRLRKRLLIAMKKYGEGKKYSSKSYGIDYDAIIEKLGNPPEDGQKYHIDHIKPCCSFDLTNPEEVRKCFAPENLRWLPAVENLRKIGQDKRMRIQKQKEGCR
jgi:hypothetical protein